MNDNTIYFYKVSDEFGAFSNFAAYPIEVDGRVWPTSEHYFQAQKFTNDEYQEKIRAEKSPMIAARLGRSRKVPIKPDWNSLRDDVMRVALDAKYRQHVKLGELLLSTGERTIVERTTADRYWADGGDGTGKNMLGILLMELRDKLRAE